MTIPLVVLALASVILGLMAQEVYLGISRLLFL